MKIQTVFVSGPLFNDSDRWLDRRIVEVCEGLGFKVFWSWRDAESTKKYSLEQLFQINKTNLEKCDILVANLDGPDVDSGTAWEIGYAIAKEKPVFGVRTDFRIHDNGLATNLMVDKSVMKTINNLEQLKLELSKLKQ